MKRCLLPVVGLLLTLPLPAQQPPTLTVHTHTERR
jgi:hypothetical protein